ncbi:MAG: polyprenol monophosphomannose synthase [Pontiellaceae bacterium]|jgi:dolichol-phosphate mannosyltransferase|nr:polyprenol monophosphomannose synthase [Pontiellaceae bacterium]
MVNDLLIVIPTYNERENVCAVAEAVFKSMPDADILFVDDNSPDGTGRLADELAAADSRVHVMHRAGKNGLGRAYIAGFKWALERHYLFICEMDADFSHNPEDLPKLRAAVQNAGLALGSRYIGGIRVINWPLSRLLLSRGAGIYVKMITGMPFTDPTGGFKCFRRCVLEAIQLDGIESSGYSFQVEMTHTAWRIGCRITEVPIVFEERRSGASKMSKNIIYEALGMVWKLFFRRYFTPRPVCRAPSKDGCCDESKNPCP